FFIQKQFLIMFRIEDSIPAQLRIDLNLHNPVVIHSRKNHTWIEGTQIDKSKQIVKNLPRDGYWRLDVIKHDDYHVSAFLQGFWSDVREFRMPLNKIKSVSI
ncbi:hypothetical protein PENTCL1PPCAC_20886, partial [Pristionchus entomophagus]